MRALRVLAVLTLALALGVSCNDGQPTAPVDDALTVQASQSYTARGSEKPHVANRDGDNFVCILPRPLTTPAGKALGLLYVDDAVPGPTDCCLLQCGLLSEEKLCPGRLELHEIYECMLCGCS
jgi:hypothetical protein